MFTSTSEGIVPIQSKRGRKKRIKDGDKCLVCDGKSVGINFGVHTCSPCKAFFRRNAIKLGKYEFTCPRDGDCPITHTTRRLCNCCRLAKCFRVGMDRNAIRTEDQRLARNRLVELNRQKRFEMNQTIQPVNLLKISQNTLSSDDQSILTNIFHAYNQTCISLRNDDVISLPDDNTLSMKKLMNMNSRKYTAFINFYKLVPQFADLSVDTKIDLLKRNFNQVHRLHSVMISHVSNTAQDANALPVRRIFPDELYFDVCFSMNGFYPFVYDPIYFKILSIILIFSPSLSTRNIFDDSFIDTHALCAIQDIYIELFWRYLLYRCSNYRRSVEILSIFIRRLLRCQTTTSKLADFVQETIANQIDQLEPIMRAMWGNENK